MEGQAGAEADNGDMVNLALVSEGFSVRHDGQVALQGYLDAYTEMNKFFQVLGPFVQFVARDVAVKLGILQEYVDGPDGDQYFSIQSMIKYEKDNNLLTNDNRPSGSRTLLRLHRALEFVGPFLIVCGDTLDEEPFGNIVSDLYVKTLGRFQGNVLVKTFAGVLKLLPKKQILFDRLTKGNAAAEADIRARLPEASEVVNIVYDHTQHIFQENDLLDLP